MKKLAVILVLFVLAAVWLSAVSITNPIEITGEPKLTGNACKIIWTKDGTMPDNVKITLRNSTSTAEVKLIEDSAPNNGLYLWTIPADIADGKHQVKVMAVTSACEIIQPHASSAFFWITAVLPPKVPAEKK